MGERLSDNFEKAQEGEQSSEWDTLKDVRFAGEDSRRYRNAQESLNDRLFVLKQEYSFNADEYNNELIAEGTLADFPSTLAEEYGVDDSIKACEMKLTGAKLTTPEDGEALYDRTNNILLDKIDKAAEDGDSLGEQRGELLRQTLDGLLADVKEFEDGEVQTLESVADHKIAKETKAYLERLKAGKLTQEYKEKYAERVTALSELRGFLGLQRKVMQEELVEEVDEPVQAEEEPVSYHFEAGIAHDGATITVGQEIPDDWFEAGVLADVRNESGFGINWKESPRIDDYLQQALNVEFSKLSEDERRHYNYSSISKKIKAEAKETKKIPDIAAIIQENRM